jgi:hypothetical protein
LIIMEIYAMYRLRVPKMHRESILITTCKQIFISWLLTQFHWTMKDHSAKMRGLITQLLQIEAIVSIADLQIQMKILNA